MRTVTKSAMLIALSLAGSACALGEQSAGERDRLCGWYRTAKDNRLIPVFKIDKTFYTVMSRGGFEIPLQECPNGLELSRKLAGGVAGTEIGFDKESEEVYISLVDQNREHHDPSFTSGEKRRMLAIAKPAWLRDAMAQPPQTNDDFLGWFEPVWCPYLRGQIQKEGNKYLLKVQILEKTGERHSWKPHMQNQLIPLPVGLGFGLEPEQDLRNEGIALRLVYSATRSRFELELRSSAKESYVTRMPLARIPPPSPGEAAARLPPTEIGIKAWD